MKHRAFKIERGARAGNVMLDPVQTRRLRSCKGQALVEFTLVFMLFLVIAWIPTDFGLAFYTSQLAQNASREGARIGAADPTLAVGATSCTLGANCASQPLGSVRREVANRLSSALLSNGVITVTRANESSVGACDGTVTARVQGTYNYFFLGLLNSFGAPLPGTLTVDRVTVMRYEHQLC